jgi:hypothetical protein
MVKDGESEMQTVKTCENVIQWDGHGQRNAQVRCKKCDAGKVVGTKQKERKNERNERNDANRYKVLSVTWQRQGQGNLMTLVKPRKAKQTPMHRRLELPCFVSFCLKLNFGWWKPGEQNFSIISLHSTLDQASGPTTFINASPSNSVMCNLSN